MNKAFYLIISIILLFASLALTQAINLLNDNDDTNDSQAFKILKTEAQKGDKDSGFLLGTLYKKGIKTPIDTAQSRYYYELAAKNNDIDSILILAWEYYQEDNQTKAIELLKRAKELGSSEALELLKELDAL